MNIYILNEKFETLDIIDTYESLIWTDRYYDVGDFELKIDIKSNGIKHLKLNNYLWIEKSKHLMIIESMEMQNDTAENVVVNIIKGRSIESILDRRIVWKQTILKGSIEDCIEQLLNENIINPSDNNRKIDNIKFKRSSNMLLNKILIEIQLYGDNILETIITLCSVNDIGFKMILENNELVFELYSGNNRSYSQDENPHITFSKDFDNVMNDKYLESSYNYKNTALIAGEGEGSNIFSTEIKNDEKYIGLKRRELYVDASVVSRTVENGTLSDEDYKKQLLQKGSEELNNHPLDIAFDAESSTEGLYEYGKDFFMGDIVQTINISGDMHPARITEYIMSFSGINGFVCYPTFYIIQGGNKNELY